MVTFVHIYIALWKTNVIYFDSLQTQTFQIKYLCHLNISILHLFVIPHLLIFVDDVLLFWISQCLKYWMN